VLQEGVAQGFDQVTIGRQQTGDRLFVLSQDAVDGDAD